MGSQLGVLKIAAKRAGLEFDEYMSRINSGQKRCTKCKDWKPQSHFGPDSSRTSGVAARCSDCRSGDSVNPELLILRKQMKVKGLAWCRGCQGWIKAELVRRGACKECHAAEARTRYANDPAYRHERRQHVHSRKRSVLMVPHEAAQQLLSDFNHNCAYCCSNPATTWDHIVPVMAGGETENGNVVPCCVSCNSSKGTQDVFEWIQKKGHKPHEAFADILILMEAKAA